MSRQRVPKIWFMAPARPPWLALGLLAISGLALVTSLIHYVVASEQVASMTAQRLDAQRLQRSHSQGLGNPRQRQSVSDGTADPAYDWNPVFADLETGVRPPWRLVSFRHDIRSETSTIVLEYALAPNTAAIPVDVLPDHWRVKELVRQSAGAEATTYRLVVESSFCALKGNEGGHERRAGCRPRTEGTPRKS